MDTEITNKFSELESRIKYQEEIHRDISLTPSGFLHGVVTNLPVIIASIFLSGIVAFIIVNNSKKSINQ